MNNEIDEDFFVDKIKSEFSINVDDDNLNIIYDKIKFYGEIKYVEGIFFNTDKLDYAEAYLSANTNLLIYFIKNKINQYNNNFLHILIFNHINLKIEDLNFLIESLDKYYGYENFIKEINIIFEEYNIKYIIINKEKYNKIAKKYINLFNTQKIKKTVTFSKNLEQIKYFE